MVHDHRRLGILGAGAAAALLSGCVQGPNYQRPPIETPAQFRGQPAVAAAGSVADSPWAQVFDDPTLQSLISEAMANSQDLKAAAARIERARAIVGVVGSQAKPQLDYRAGGGVEKTFAPDVDSVGTVKFGSLGASLEAAWEFDVWGRIRRSTEAAEADLMEQEDIRRGVTLTLVADIASGYYRLLELDREVAIAEDSARVYQDTLDLFTRRFEAGRDNRLPVERARAAYESSSARLEDLKRQIALQENAISVLVGGYPRAIPRGRPLLEQSSAGAGPGVTTDLLQRRPDILAAEQRMISANATVGVAIANRFPRIGLSALAGAVDSYVKGDWAGFGLWNLGLGASGPIFTGGRLDAVEKERRAHWDETVAEYRKTILVAFQETADALAAQQTLAQRRVALESQVAALRRSSDLALTRYNSGRASYFEVLEAQQQLFPAEAALAQTQGDQLLANVGLYKALGGGWRTAGPGAATAPG